MYWMFEIIYNGESILGSEFEYETEEEALFNAEEMIDDMVRNGQYNEGELEAMASQE